MREMVIYGVSFDMVGKQPIVFEDDRRQPLPADLIGHPEAAAILVKLQNAASARPMTHDLLNDVLAHLDAEVISVAVTEMRENTYYARITLQQNGAEIEVDSRPSDAIALAVRAGAKIYVADDVIEESGVEFEGCSTTRSRPAAGVFPAELDPDEGFGPSSTPFLPTSSPRTRKRAPRPSSRSLPGARSRAWSGRAAPGRSRATRRRSAAAVRAREVLQHPLFPRRRGSRFPAPP